MIASFVVSDRCQSSAGGWSLRWGLGCCILACCGAKAIADKGVATERAIEETPISESDRDHWSFRPMVRPLYPSVIQRDWPMNEVDYFVLAKLEEAHLKPAGEADRLVLLRRLKLDLLGLPPSSDEIEAFVSDRAPDAYERWVDRFLASPRYGEHWAQAWLDLARFAETDGFEHDRVRKDAWRYRDWVIESLNADTPYDEFIFHQLAGDVVHENSSEIATMFCLAGPDMPDLNDQTLRRHDRLNEVTSTIGAVLLGLQFHCAQCHDHKVDPISQADFYRLRAIFESSIPAMERDKPWNTLRSRISTIPAKLYFRGELQLAGPEIRPGVPRIAADPKGAEDWDGDEEEPRVALVRWLFEERNPLTARVIVNRLWQHHFGRGLFENPSDVGLAPAGPTHPELLDWLATEMRAKRWSFKAIHRLIATSATYRQASFADNRETAWSDRLESDARNQWYSRFPRHRLAGEVIRDAMLAAAGLIEFQSGGESVMPPLPQELVSTLLKGQWKTSEREADHYRRSIYLFARRNLRYPFFEAFDRPDAGASCAKRDLSTTAIQSLQMLNSELSIECSRRLAERIRRESASESPIQVIDETIERLFYLTLSRSPRPAERTLLRTFLTGEGASSDALLTAACLAMFNTSEFVYLE